MKLKLVVVSFSLIAFCAAIYIGLVAKQRLVHPQKAYQYFLAKNFPAAKQALMQTPLERLAMPFSLYEAYLAQPMGRFEESKALLTPLSQAKIANQNRELYAQASSAWMNACYQTGDDDALTQKIDSLKQEGFFSPPTLFFDGLSHYLAHQYTEAYRLWGLYSPDLTTQTANWSHALIEHFYPSSWRQIHLAHCLLEKGDIVASRELLERLQHEMNDCQEHQHHLATLFLGLTYLMEASTLAPPEKSSYYQLAHFYFKNATCLDGLDREKDSVINHVEIELKKLSSQTLAKHAHPWTFAFIQLLQDWQASAALDSLAEHFVTELLKENQPHAQEFCSLLKQQDNLGSYHRLICLKLTAHLYDAIAHHQEKALTDLWQLLVQLSPPEQATINQLASAVEEHLLKSLFWDDQQLSRSRLLINFYRQLTKNTHNQQLLVVKLIKQANQLWQQAGQEQRGQALMDLALEMSSNKQEITNLIAQYLKDLYQRAEENNLLVRLALIYDALTHFKITLNKSSYDAAKIANHVADAEYLYEVRNYLAAQTHALWALKLDPNNRKARQIAGLSAFHLGDYEHALATLTDLSQPTLAVQKAIAFSIAYAKQAQEQHIAQIDTSVDLSEDE